MSPAAQLRRKGTVLSQEDRLTDAVTGLPNRARFLGFLDGALDRARAESGYRYAVCSVGMNRSSASDGSQYGADYLMVEIAHRLRAATRPQDAVARVSDDEFAVLIRGLRAGADAAAQVDILRGALQTPVALGARQVQISASFGAAVEPPAGVRAAELLRDASAAMHGARERDGKVRAAA